MRTKNIELVKQSWLLVAEIDREIVGRLFYNRLFEIAPEVRPMFSAASLPEQSGKLLSMLSYVISKLDRLAEIVDEVAKLAKRHCRYGVKDEHYAAVGKSLLWTLEKGLGENWNDELNAAWTDIYGLLSAVMINVQKDEMKDVAVLQ